LLLNKPLNIICFTSCKK